MVCGVTCNPTVLKVSGGIGFGVGAIAIALGVIALVGLMHSCAPHLFHQIGGAIGKSWAIATTAAGGPIALVGAVALTKGICSKSSEGQSFGGGNDRGVGAERRNPWN